jgi:hypothetical protein
MTVVDESTPASVDAVCNIAPIVHTPRDIVTGQAVFAARIVMTLTGGLGE